MNVAGYVFCLLAIGGDKRALNPMILDQWEFYVAETSRVDAEFGNSKTISLKPVQRLTEATGLDDPPDSEKIEVDPRL